MQFRGGDAISDQVTQPQWNIYRTQHEKNRGSEKSNQTKEMWAATRKRSVIEKGFRFFFSPSFCECRSNTVCPNDVLSHR